MTHYFVNNAAQATGEHEVHRVGCIRMPVDKRYLGNFYNVDEAMIEARKDFWVASGCSHCSHASLDRTGTVRQLRLPLPQFFKHVP